MPQRVPISPQWRMNWRWMSVSFVISVLTEITEYISGVKESKWPGMRRLENLQTTLSAPAGGQECPSPTGLLDFHDFFFFALAHVFHLLDFVIGKFLNFFEGALFVVFRDLLVFHRFLD